MPKVAHDSGDSAIIFHCPSCGSGQVIAQSDGSTKCEFCNMAFTVQVQPQFNAYPQTIDGQPVDVPNMPGEIENPVLDASEVGPDGEPLAPDAGGDFPPGEDGDEDAPPFGADDVDEEGDASPVAKEEQDDAKEDAEEKDESHSNPFGKKSMRTENGTALPLDEFKKHLALKFSYDRDAVLDVIRRSAK